MTERKKTGKPVFRMLSRDEAEAVLTRNHVGRVAFTFHSRVDLEPVSYVYADGWIYLRTSSGTKLSTVVHNRWVAFEVDEVDGMFDWRSTVVKGTVEVIPHEVASAQNPLYEQALALLRRHVPETFTSEDPVPFRQFVLRIHLDEVTGREARSAEG